MVPHNNAILVATAGGLVVVDPDSKAAKRLFHATPGQHTPNYAPDTLLDAAGFWHVSTNGLTVLATGSAYIYRLDVDSGNVLASLQQAKQAGQFNPSRTFASAITANGQVYVGTDTGVVVTDSNFTTFSFVTHLNGERLGSVRDIVLVDDQTLWLTSSAAGLLRYDLAEAKWYSYAKEDGLHSHVTAQGALSIGATGDLITATAVGISVGKTTMQLRQGSYKLELQGLDVGSNASIKHGDTVELYPDTREFAVDFLVPQLLEDDRYKLNYTISDSNGKVLERYIPLGQTVEFQSLQPGEYQFNGVLTAVSGAASDPFTFALLVHPHWWQTPAYRLSTFVMFAGLLIATFVRRARRIEQRHSIIASERSCIARELHDTSLQDIFGVRLLANMLAMDVPNDQKPKVDKFIQLTDNAIQALRQSVNSLSELTSGPPISEAVKLLDDAIVISATSRLTIAERGKPWHLRDSSRFFLFRMIKEVVTNTAKHAEATEIHLTLIWSPWSLQVHIQDNGKGFDPSLVDESASYGQRSLRIMAKAARIKFQLDSQVGRGTRVTLSAQRLFV